MIIKKLELQGFKSFPDRTKIVFHPGITAVVGPNGTGKSNIVDALLWVLGGQRQKLLRGAKTEDIIFNGTQKRPALGMADVTVSFENEQENIVVNHRLFRSGESEYKLNGKTCRLKDVHDALWKRAVAENEYFVIEQGAIGLLLTSKPAEKRQLLEEAAGTAFYKEKKKQAESKLETTEQNLIRLEDIIAEVAKAKNSLQRQASAATRYRKLRERQRELTALHFSRKIQILEKRQAESHATHENCLTQEKDLVAGLKNEERELTQKRTDLWELERNLKEAEERLRSLELQIRRAEMEKDSKRLDIIEEKRKSARASLEDLEQDLLALVLEIARAGESAGELRRALEAKQREMADAEARIRTLEEAEAGWRKNLEELKTGHLQRVFEVTEIRNEAGRAEKELELLLRQEEKLRSQLTGEDTLLAENERRLGLIREDLEKRVLDRDEERRRIEELKRTHQETGENIERLEVRFAELKQKRDLDYYELQALKKLDLKERESAGREQVPGSLGILADLLEAEPEYAPLLDVFWKEEARAAAVPAGDFLRNFPGGDLKSQVLLLSGHQKRDLPATLLQDPDVVGLLKAHVRPDPRIKDFLPQLEEAAIARDVVTAVRLWMRHPSLNVITLGGDLLLASGLLKPGRKGEGIFALAAEIKKLEERIRRADEEIAPVLAELENRKTAKKDLEDRLRAQSAELAVLEKTIQEAEREMALAEAAREKALSNSTLFRKEMDILLAEKRELDRKRDDFAAGTARLEAEEKELRSRFDTEETKFSAERENLVREEKARVELRAACDLLAEKIRNADAGQAAVFQRKEAAAVKSQALRDEILRLENEEAGLRDMIMDLDFKAGEMETERQRRLVEIQDLEMRRQVLHAEEMEREKTLNRLREEAEAKKDERVKWEITKAEVERDLANLEETCWQELKKTLTEVKADTRQIEMFDEEIEKELAETDEELQKYKAVNLMAEEEYLGQKNRYDFLVQQRNDLRDSISATQEAIRMIDEESKTRFLTALSEVKKNFQEIFSLLFKGGTADVRLIEPENPLETGLDIIAQPPGKKVQNITLLSGGEKSLTSLAFLFALFRYKPTPFCILDEVDAALDENNLKRFLDLMEKIKIETQFIIITHNYKTMEVADYIYGTTMDEPNVTRLYSVKLERKEEAPQEG